MPEYTCGEKTFHVPSPNNVQFGARNKMNAEPDKTDSHSENFQALIFSSYFPARISTSVRIRRKVRPVEANSSFDKAAFCRNTHNPFFLCCRQKVWQASGGLNKPCQRRVASRVCTSRAGWSWWGKGWGSKDLPAEQVGPEDTAGPVCLACWSNLPSHE